MIVHETDVTTGEQLSTGGSSVVYRGKWLGTPVAIKKWLNSGNSESEMSEMRREIMSNAVSFFSLMPSHPSLVYVVRCGGEVCRALPTSGGFALDGASDPPTWSSLTLTTLGIRVNLHGFLLICMLLGICRDCGIPT